MTTFSLPVYPSDELATALAHVREMRSGNLPHTEEEVLRLRDTIQRGIYLLFHESYLTKDGGLSCLEKALEHLWEEAEFIERQSV